MWLAIILKVTKNQGFTLSLEDTFFEKPIGRGVVKLTPLSSRFRVNIETFGTAVATRLFTLHNGTYITALETRYIFLGHVTV